MSFDQKQEQAKKKNEFVNETVICEFCGKYIKKDNYENHIVKNHNVSIRTISNNVTKTKKKENVQRKVSFDRKFTLASAKYNVVGEGLCEKCLVISKRLRKYQATDGAPVCLCDYCSEIELQETFGSKDLLDYAISGQGSPFKRRRR